MLIAHAPSALDHLRDTLCKNYQVRGARCCAKKCQMEVSRKWHNAIEVPMQRNVLARARGKALADAEVIVFMDHVSELGHAAGSDATPSPLSVFGFERVVRSIRYDRRIGCASVEPRCSVDVCAEPVRCLRTCSQHVSLGWGPKSANRNLFLIQ
jgi:hypothetical protein